MSTQAVKKTIRWGVFLPPFVIILAVLVLNLTNYEIFVSTMSTAVDFILINFSWLFNSTMLLSFIVVVIAYFSPVKNVRLGGSGSKPLLGYANFVWIVLCTIMGSGLMLWATAEPMYHIHHPPANIISGPLSGEAILWAMQIIFLEWTFPPMAIYALPSILFAFVFYNMKKPFAIGSMLAPAFTGNSFYDNRLSNKITPVIDSICMLSLGLVMAASLGTGILLTASGIEKVSRGAIVANPTLLIISGLFIIAAFITSAASGLMRGIRVLSKINSYFYLALGLLVFFFGPTIYILDLCIEGFGAFLSDFFKIGLWTSTSWSDGWSRWWPTFYWSVWLAWMPVSAVFLGRISRGYTVREALNVIFVIPSVFSVIWLAIFSGTAINYELSGFEIYNAMQSGGIAAATYAVLEVLPLSTIIVPIFLLTVLLSFVTSADSNTNAIAGLCVEGLSTDDSESPLLPKIVWGLAIGALCIIMLLTFDIEGVKMLSNLAGLPIVFLMLIFIFGFVKIIRNPKKYDIFKKDYDENGNPIPSKRISSDQ